MHRRIREALGKNPEHPWLKFGYIKESMVSEKKKKFLTPAELAVLTEPLPKLPTKHDVINCVLQALRPAQTWEQVRATCRAWNACTTCIEEATFELDYVLQAVSYIGFVTRLGIMFCFLLMAIPRIMNAQRNHSLHIPLEGNMDLFWGKLIDYRLLSPSAFLYRKEKSSELSSSSRFDGLLLGGLVHPQEWVVIEVASTAANGRKQKVDRKKVIDHAMRMMEAKRLYLAKQLRLHGREIDNALQGLVVWGIVCQGE